MIEPSSLSEKTSAWILASLTSFASVAVYAGPSRLKSRRDTLERVEVMVVIAGEG